MLAQTYAPVHGGEERMVEQLSGQLAARGHEVAVATLRQPVGEPPARGDGVRIHLLDSAVHRIPGIPVHEERRYAAPLPDPRTTAQLRRVLREERPDVVHAHNWLVDSYLPLAKRAAPPLVMSLHDYSLLCPTKRLFLDGAVCSGPGLRKCLAHSFEFYGAGKGAMVGLGTRLAEPWARRRIDMFLSVSSAVEELCRVDDTKPHRVIPNFVAELPPAPPEAEEMLAALPEEPFVLYFGDVGEDKGAGCLIEAYRRLDSPPPLVLIGRRVLPGLEPGDGIFAPGPLPHAVTIEALRRSLFSVVPSIWAEPFGVVALEAGAAGKAIVASDIGGLRDVVVDGETGLLVAPGDRAALAAAIERLLAEPEQRERMGKAAQARVREVFSPEAVVSRYEDAYRAVIGSRQA